MKSTPNLQQKELARSATAAALTELMGFSVQNVVYLIVPCAAILRIGQRLGMGSTNSWLPFFFAVVVFAASLGVMAMSSSIPSSRQRGRVILIISNGTIALNSIFLLPFSIVSFFSCIISIRGTAIQVIPLAAGYTSLLLKGHSRCSAGDTPRNSSGIAVSLRLLGWRLVWLRLGCLPQVELFAAWGAILGAAM